jgi:hypothetical protein
LTKGNLVAIFNLRLLQNKGDLKMKLTKQKRISFASVKRASAGDFSNCVFKMKDYYKACEEVRKENDYYGFRSREKFLEEVYCVLQQMQNN